MHRTTTSLLFSLLLGCDAGTGSSDSGVGAADTGVGDGGQEGEELAGDDTAATTTAVALLENPAGPKDDAAALDAVKDDLVGATF